MSISDQQLNDEQLRSIYAWIDAIPLSRPKKNMARDFSDGVMLAEVIAAYFPHLVEIHNYPAANNIKQKIYNHETLNSRVLKKLGYALSREMIDDIVNAKPGVIEVVLNKLQIKMAKYREKKLNGNDNQSQSPPPQSLNKPNRKPENIPYQQPQHNLNKQFNQQQHPTSNNINNIHHRNKNADIGASVDEEILIEKEQQIRELQETVEILELKIAKLEQLVRLKDNKIQKLLNK